MRFLRNDKIADKPAFKRSYTNQRRPVSHSDGGGNSTILFHPVGKDLQSVPTTKITNGQKIN